MPTSATATRRTTGATANGTKRKASPRSGPVQRIKPTTPPLPGARPQTEESITKTADLVTDLLDSYGFKYTLVRLDTAAINRKQSELNQARVAKPIDEDQVVLYAVAMERGDRFPPIVVYRRGNEYIVLDGNHRVAAADMTKPAIEVLDAYVVENPSPAQVTAFTFEANTRHGLPTSTQDRLRQAIHLVASKQKTQVDAAKSLGLDLNQLRSAYDQYEADQRFDELGVKKYRDLTPTARRRLSSIHNDPVLKAAADLVVDAGIGGDDLTTLVRRVNELRSERDQLGFVREERERRQSIIKATAGGRMPVKQTLVTLARMTSTINRMDVANLTRDLLEMPTEVRLEHQKALSETVSRAMTLIRAIQSTPDQG